MGFLQACDHPHDRVADREGLRKDIMIPEAQDRESGSAEECVAYRIVSGVAMLSAIDFDHETMFEADEVEDVTIVRVLTAELAALDLSVPEYRPQCSFRVGHPAAQSPLQLRCVDPCVILRFHAYSPRPSPSNPSPPNPPLEGEGFKALAAERVGDQPSPSQ
jgi:hypothetical protein